MTDATIVLAKLIGVVMVMLVALMFWCLIVIYTVENIEKRLATLIKEFHQFVNGDSQANGENNKANRTKPKRCGLEIVLHKNILDSFWRVICHQSYNKTTSTDCNGKAQT